MDTYGRQTPRLTVGQRHTVSIADVAFGGEGVARVQQFVVFIPFVLAGEKVETELTEVKRQFARGRLVKVLEPSAARVSPKCPYFGECGGCQYQHIDYPHQLALKRKQVEDLLRRLGGVSGDVVAPVVPCPQAYGYRNRIMVRTQWDKVRQQLSVGFLRHDNRLVVDVAACQIVEPVLNEQLAQVRAKPPPHGGLKVVLRVHPEGWDVPADAFFQNNFHLLPQLVETVRERLGASGAKYLLDVYCGVGFFSIELADLVKKYVGVEFDQRAVRAARRNAEARKRWNGEFLAGRAEETLASLVAKANPIETAVLIDPPRTGCQREVLRVLCQARPVQVLYVSCHPATLARDLNVLCAEGVYQLVQVVPLDMFPQTRHVECVADLRAAVQTIEPENPVCARQDRAETPN